MGLAGKRSEVPIHFESDLCLTGDLLCCPVTQITSVSKKIRQTAVVVSLLRHTLRGKSLLNPGFNPIVEV